MQHRLILLVPNRRTFSDIGAFHEHWNVRHADSVRPVPHVVGYVQNRPVDHSWSWGPFRACAELFFDSADGERAAWDSRPWREQLAPDEHYLLDVEQGWSAVVTATERLREGRAGPVRVLAFGGDAARLPEGQGAAGVVRLDDAPPVEGASSHVLSAFVADQSEAERVAEAVGGTCLVAEAARIITPPEWPWGA